MIVLLATYYVHIAYFTVNVVLYAAVLDALIALAIMIGMLFLSIAVIIAAVILS
ncbi:MAG: hypothetical protein IE926_18570 [Micrococcales bacterium]|nr:hypothetical protein [Micrococcales bacterium]